MSQNKCVEWFWLFCLTILEALSTVGSWQCMQPTWLMASIYITPQVVEITKGSKVKYELDKKTGLIKVCVFYL